MKARSRSRHAFAMIAMMVCARSDARGDPLEKRVEVDKSLQVLRCYENENLVFSTRVSTGRNGHETPTGLFEAAVKYRMHYSSRYHNAPMPFSVQFNANYFIHGFTDVPSWPASHGCVRVPLAGQGEGNPAAWFYGWVETGTPIRVFGQWNSKPVAPTPWQPVAARSKNRSAKTRIPILTRLFGGTEKQP